MKEKMYYEKKKKKEQKKIFWIFYLEQSIEFNHF
jgi:hypothetical protein